MTGWRSALVHRPVTLTATTGEFPGSRRLGVTASDRSPRPTPGVDAGCRLLGVALVVGRWLRSTRPLAHWRYNVASQTQLTWIVDGYTVMLACLLLPAGAIGDRYGRRAALLGLTVFAAASASPAMFDSPSQIIAARMVGVGAAL